MARMVCAVGGVFVFVYSWLYTFDTIFRWAFMNIIDWIVLCGTLSAIVLYGIWKGRQSARDIAGYVLGSRELPWYNVALSVMATQASAITFLSVPGQAYTDGMRFVQFYFGLPLAMIVLCVTAIPLYSKLNVFTAYQYLETRFDVRTRVLTSALFLIQRGLAAGLTIYAPSLILSLLLGWDIRLTIVLTGILAMLYTVTGGAKAVSYTQSYQLMIILCSMGLAFWVVLSLLPQNVSFSNALTIAGSVGKMNAINFHFDINDRYNIWSGIIGGFFLQLSYFGTDQSQVQRYLSGQSITQSRIGLLVNGMVKIPMQFAILILGIMVFVAYQFVTPPLFFNATEITKLQQSSYSEQYQTIEKEYARVAQERTVSAQVLAEALTKHDASEIARAQDALRRSHASLSALRTQTTALMKTNDRTANTNDTNYIFLSFVLAYLPVGLVGLVIAAIISASMSSISSEVNALASTSLVDVYKRLIKPSADDEHYVRASKVLAAVWAGMIILFAQFLGSLGSLVEAVNVLGSLFYGTILGIFLTAFYVKRVNAKHVFVAAIIAEGIVLFCYLQLTISFLWFNLIGCGAVVFFGLLLSWIQYKPQARV